MYTENDKILQQNVGEGVVRKVLSYSDNLMCCELKFKKGSIGALHSHPHEQIGYVISGSFEYEEEGSKVVVKAGDSYYVAPNILHGVVALEDSVLLDIFAPKREDFLL
jgi:quercetin dioxygenase-like cupin family protein